MSLRYCYLGLVAIALAVPLSGCCGGLCGTPWPCGKTYYGTQCGCKYWHWWFSHKPPCCEACDDCGNFTASHNPYVVNGPPYTPFGPVYSDGSGSNQPGAIGELYSAPTGPTPADAPPEGVLDEASPMNDLEQFPPTTSVPRGANPRTAARYGPVDSAYGSRTLGRSPRARLFSR